MSSSCPSPHRRLSNEDPKPLGQELGETLLSTAQKQTSVIGKVLLVDDNVDLLEMAEALLQDIGFEVITAESGEEALRILTSQTDISAMLTDVVMPGMSGIELGTEARKILPGLKIVLVSGYPNSADEDGKRDVHEFEFLKKPYRITEVLRVLSKLN
ncbi:response regulator [Noviherbaspirillum aridicola]|uniref:Response regulatory domain-containing protein n=1 Tax=Noviherbaspirillum aridicola TaxID=2849687 RepID=A0ABQ4QA02_9BURK|nr:response regulator [Noviherbaspirillum aridicola]GIZ53707.1 hypothetical protein NCCP691_37210 [Noviherbaspirillum aridicola]